MSCLENKIVVIKANLIVSSLLLKKKKKYLLDTELSWVFIMYCTYGNYNNHVSVCFSSIIEAIIFCIKPFDCSTFPWTHGHLGPPCTVLQDPDHLSTNDVTNLFLDFEAIVAVQNVRQTTATKYEYNLINYLFVINPLPFFLCSIGHIILRLLFKWSVYNSLK